MFVPFIFDNNHFFVYKYTTQNTFLGDSITERNKRTAHFFVHLFFLYFFKTFINSDTIWSLTLHCERKKINERTLW